MFSLFKKKGAGGDGVTVVHADVGATLTRQASFPAQPGSAAVPSPILPHRALDNPPPQGKWLDEYLNTENSVVYVAEASGNRPRLAFVNATHPTHVAFEVWELGPGEKPAFLRKRAVQLDPEQGSWRMSRLRVAAALPGNKFLFALTYAARQTKDALFLYDGVGNSSTKISDVIPVGPYRDFYFAAQSVAPDAVIVQYFPSEIRLAAEVYYYTPSHLRLFAPRYPQGIEILQLAAQDGSVERWTVIDKTLWLASKDWRQRHNPKDFIWSLNLERVLPR